MSSRINGIGLNQIQMQQNKKGRSKRSSNSMVAGLSSNGKTRAPSKAMNRPISNASAQDTNIKKLSTGTESTAQSNKLTDRQYKKLEQQFFDMITLMR
ncbi:MAG: hypothetical protein GY874_08165 [Desulfobacteraceae bacterium]|nr:hypothetical protein [Desulfobacteraceae bacterium]